MKLNLIDNNQNLPAGLIDESVEFFLHDNEVYCTTLGKTYSFDELPIRVKDIMNADMAKYPKKIACLIDWGLEDEGSQMRQYIACLHGGHDTTADICKDGAVQQSEYVNCGKHGLCLYEGKLCNSIVLKFGTLTKSEIAVLTEIGNCLLDKEIADKLNISEHTIRHHKDSICRKSGLERKPALVGLAYKLGLVS